MLPISTRKAPTPTPIVKGKLPAPNSNDPVTAAGELPSFKVPVLGAGAGTAAKTLRNNWDDIDDISNKQKKVED
jgi:hypothetical protein